jgi:hypothetical protein
MSKDLRGASASAEESPALPSRGRNPIPATTADHPTQSDRLVRSASALVTAAALALLSAAAAAPARGRR